MKRKKILAVCLALVLAFAFVMPTFATSSSYNYDGRAYYNFKTSGSVTKGNDDDWVKFVCHVTSVTYWFSDYNSCKARPISSSGVALAGYKEITSGSFETYYTSSTANTAKFQLKNLDPNHDNEMHAIGSVTMTYN